MKNIFVTGGAGFLGRAYMRWAREAKPDWRFTIFSRDEGKHAKARREFSGPHYRYVIGDIRDPENLALALAGHDTILHAGAFKYVPQGETNGMECFGINALGSANIVRAAIRADVERVVGISTDKACSPINNYGISKLVMERFFQEADARSDTRFNLVRYGNVVSSTGSVIPIFKHQVEDQGFVTLTEPKMTRFWLTVKQAVGLVNLALEEKQGGTILVPRCPSISMGELAAAVTDKIRVTGLRFGEKIHESLINEVEGRYTEEAVMSASEACSLDVMRLWPTTSPVQGHLPAYSSEKPDHTLTPEELLAMIAEAPGE